ncbi:5-oxoprolinase subunit PxpB [Ekhidna sp.]|uniref:5-oxoprolinase subunit PxpB n=1 Tax=Ekhidna sp. TaxID=2608089 RepID=UPI00351706BF
MSLLDEQVVLLECPVHTPIERIHGSTHLIEQILSDHLEDIVPAYHSIAIFSKLSIEYICASLDGKNESKEEIASSKRIVKLPICYELGMDLERVSTSANLSEDQVIELHLKGTYRSLFIGFTPGFIYADGLDEKLACVRLENPRNQIPAGSVGIGGNQTGIYSLASPGGWNIIGRTPEKIFDPKNKPPMLIDVGTSYQFYRISKAEFEAWES